MSIAVTDSALEEIYRKVLGDFRDEKEFLWKHRGGFVHFILSAITEGRLSPEFGRKNFKLERLSYALDPGRDELLDAHDVEELVRAGLLHDAQGNIIEAPQYYWMRRAMADCAGSPNPTRSALTLYEMYSRSGIRPQNHGYGSDIFNNQRLLFDVTRPVAEAGFMDVPANYSDHGWTVIDNVADEFEAIKVQETFLNSIGAQTQLAKADQIPVCDDIVATSFQVLHFDMGHPFVESPGQLFVSHVGIYLPRSIDYEVTAATRVVELPGLLRHLGMPAATIESRLTDYVLRFGDGWEGHNSMRLAAFARLLDGVGGRQELSEQIDKTVGQWFGNEPVEGSEAYEMEADFFARHGIELSSVEKRVYLKPGQLLLLDNTRVIHGRIGHRKAKELFNYMWGVPELQSRDISQIREQMCARLTS